MQYVEGGSVDRGSIAHFTPVARDLSAPLPPKLGYQRLLMLSELGTYHSVRAQGCSARVLLSTEMSRHIPAQFCASKDITLLSVKPPPELGQLVVPQLNILLQYCSRSVLAYTPPNIISQHQIENKQLLLILSISQARHFKTKADELSVI